MTALQRFIAEEDLAWMNTPISEILHGENDCPECGMVDVVDHGKCRYCGEDFTE